MITAKALTAGVPIHTNVTGSFPTVWRVLKVEGVYVEVCADADLERHERWKLNDLRKWCVEGWAEVRDRFGDVVGERESEAA